MVGYLSEADAIRTFEFECLADGFLFVFIVGKALPLGVDRMHRSTWKDAFVDDCAPVRWVFGSPARVFAHHVEDFDDFTN